MENSNVFLDNTGKLIIENGRIIYRNFSGAASDYNHEGDRNFCVFIDDPEVAERLAEDGWNVKIRQPRDESDTVSHYIKVNVSYKYKGPKICRHIGAAVIDVDETTVGELDKDDIISCDLVINPFTWSRNGRDGVSAYLQELHAVIRPDYFSDKYGKQIG